jgi:hypothetical protein
MNQSATMLPVKFEPMARYFAIHGIYESSHGLSPDGRWYGAIVHEDTGAVYRTILDGENAARACEIARTNKLLYGHEAPPHPLFETTSSGAVADAVGPGSTHESYNDNYEMPMGYRERTSQQQSDGRTVIWTPPFAPAEEADKTSWSWVQIEGSDQPALHGGIFAQSDGRIVHVVEIMPSDQEFRTRSAKYVISDLNRFDENAAAAIGLSLEAWQSAPYHERAHAKLSYYGTPHENAYDDFSDALKAELGQNQQPPRA